MNNTPTPSEESVRRNPVTIRDKAIATVRVFEKLTFEERCAFIAKLFIKHDEEIDTAKTQGAMEFLKGLYEPIYLDGGACNICVKPLCYCPERQIVKDEWHENILTKAIRQRSNEKEGMG